MIMRKLPQLITGILMLFIQAPISDANTTDRFTDISARFELVNADGKLVTEQDFQGHYTLVAFGFTHCLHICPMMAANMALALKIGPSTAQGVFVSVDTERDSPAVTHVYASSYSKSMVGLGGSYAQIRQAANNFKVSYVVTKSQKAYTVEHTSDIFLLDPHGDVVDIFALNASPKAMAKAMTPAAD